jgi:CHAT domain-containing protein
MDRDGDDRVYDGVHTRFAVIVVTLISTLASSAIAIAAAGDDPRATVTSYYEWFAAGDVQAAQRLWSTPLSLADRRTIKGNGWNRCSRLLRLDIGEMQPAADGAMDVAVYSVLEKQLRDGSEQHIEERHDKLHMVRADGKWKIASRISREQELATAIANAATEGEAWALIRRSDELVNSTMLRSLLTRITRQMNENKMERARSTNAILAALADELRDTGASAQAAEGEAALLRVGDPSLRKAAMTRALEAVELARRAGDSGVLARVLLTAARIHLELDEAAEGKAMFEEIVAMNDRLEQPRFTFEALNYLSGMATEHDDLRGALGYAKAAESVLDTREDPLADYSLAMTLADIYEYIGDYQSSAPQYRRAADDAIASGYTAGLSYALGGLADASLQLNDTARYEETAQEALCLARQTNQNISIANNLIGLAVPAMTKREFRKAEKLLNEALYFAQSSGSPGLVAAGLNRLARLRRLEKNYESSRQLSDESLHLLQDTRTTEVFNALVVSARTARAQGRLADSESRLRRAVTLAEEWRALAGEDARELAISFEDRAIAYHELVELLTDEGRITEAFSWAEQAKARALLDLLRRRGSGSPEITVTERNEEQRLETAVTEANKELAQAREAHDKARETATEAALARKRVALDSFRGGLSFRYPGRSVPLPSPSDDLISQLPSGAALIEYVVTEERLTAFVVANGPDGHRRLTVHTTRITEDALNRRVSKFAERVSQRALDYEGDARALHALLIQPLLADLRGAKALCIVPHGSLSELPFEALVAKDGRFLAERYAVFYSPSAAVWIEMSQSRSDQPPAKRSFLGVGNPAIDRTTASNAKVVTRGIDLSPLPEAEREMNDIAGLFGREASVVRTGRAALESAVKRESGDYGVLHFATHGVLDDHNPMYSYLVLARTPDDNEDGLLEARELMGLHIRAQLAVLSACDTARGTVRAGEGLIGMTWALFIAGCPSTVAAQWKVASNTTSVLMVAFYRHLLHDGAGPIAKAAALQKARLATMRDGRHRHPYYWAPFVLVGSAR